MKGGAPVPVTGPYGVPCGQVDWGDVERAAEHGIGLCGTADGGTNTNLVY